MLEELSMSTSNAGVRLVLASASPRRHELLSLLNVPFTVVKTDAEETDTSPPPTAIVSQLPVCPLPTYQHPTLLAWRKVQAVWQTTQTDVVLGADTIVAHNNVALTKPQDAAHARRMLTQLSGQTHTVYTGLCIHSRLESTYPLQQGLALMLVASDVTFFPLHDTDITAYIATGEPFDKAGGYAVQGKAGAFIQRVEGSYTSVVGLPLAAVATLLTAAGLPVLRDPKEAYISWLQSQGKESPPCPPTFV
jgi:septum formation protein